MEVIPLNFIPYIWVLIAYLIGSFPTGVLYSRLLHDIDVRNLGSGNSGATNVGRNFGMRAALLVTTIDVLKGYIPVLLATLWFPTNHLAIMLTVSACVLGHAYPIWASFRGGKIVATSIGTLLAFSFPLGLACAILLGIFIFLSSTVSLSAMTSFSTIALYIALTNDEKVYQIGFLLVALFLIYRHRANVVRLLQGKESRIRWGLRK